MGCLEGYLGLFEPILRHLGDILGPRFFRNLRPKIAVPHDRHLVTFWSPFWDPQFAFLCSCWDHFLITFWATFVPILGPILGSDRPKKGQDEPKRAIKRFTQSQNSAMPKTLKNNWFSNVFRVQRPPNRASRGPRRLPRGTQRAPKLQQKGIQK